VLHFNWIDVGRGAKNVFQPSVKGSFWQSCVNKWPGASATYAANSWVLNTFWLCFLCSPVSDCFIPVQVIIGDLGRHVFVVSSFFLYFFLSRGGNICLIMSAKCLSLCSFSCCTLLCLCPSWMHKARFFLSLLAEKGL